MFLTLFFGCANPQDPIFSVADAQAAVNDSSYNTDVIAKWDASADGILQRSELEQVNDDDLAALYNAIVSNDGKTWLRGSSISAALEDFIDGNAQAKLVPMPTVTSGNLPGRRL